MTSYCRNPVTYTAHQRAIVGDTKMSVIANDHLGWLRCDGRTLNVNDYYLLWRVIGYSFGSNGSSNTFNLPNAEGRVPGVIGTGADANASTLTVALGDYLGEYNHTLTIDEMPSHKHGSNDVSGNTNGNGNTTTNGSHAHTGTTDSAGWAASSLNVSGAAVLQTDVADNAGNHVHTFTTNSNGDHFHSIGSTGGSNFHNNVQPMIGLGNMFIFCGKYMYPSDASIPYAGYPYLSNSQIL